MPARLTSTMAVWLLGLSIVGVVTQSASRIALADPTPGCVLDMTGALAWWRGQDNLSAEIGPDLTGSVGFADAAVRRGMAFDQASAASVEAFPAVSSALTVEMWVRPTNSASAGLTQTLASRWDFPGTDDSARTFSLLLDPYANLVWATDETSMRRPEELRASVPQILDGNFHHVAATWDGSLIQLYFDGVEVASRPSQGGVLNPAAATPFRLGSKTGLGDPFRFEGVIDEPSVWDRVLESSEIAAIVNAGSSGKCPPQPSLAKLTAADAAASDQFGSRVAIAGNTAVIGAAGDGVGPAAFSGSTYVFTRTGNTWSQQAKLTAPDAATLDSFGESVAIAGDTAVIGASGDDDNGSDSGSAYVFTRVGTTWTLQTKLTASDAATDDLFGSSVSIDSGSIVVGAHGRSDAGILSGAAYVFTLTGTAWSQQAKLTASDAEVVDFFGRSVSIAGDTVVIGAFNDSTAVVNSGSAYVFTRTGTTWNQQAKLTASDAAPGDLFGWAVSINGGTAVVGARGNDTGSAYAFTRTGTTWSQQAKLTASDAAPGDLFGIAVSIDGDTAVVGASSDPLVGGQSGSAYMFRRTGGSWSEHVELSAPDATPEDAFGISVAYDGDTAIVGAYGDDDAGSDSGSAYVFANY